MPTGDYRFVKLSYSKSSRPTMDTMPFVHHINHTNIRDFLQKHVNNIAIDNKVSDDNLLKLTVHKENSEYKNSIIVTSDLNAAQKNSHAQQKLEIYRDRFGASQRMVFSQKVCRQWNCN